MAQRHICSAVYRQFEVWAEMEVTSHKITLGVNWARLGSERDGEMDKEGGRERERERERERKSLED